MFSEAVQIGIDNQVIEQLLNQNFYLKLEPVNTETKGFDTLIGRNL